jgi:hypothetical protein
VNRPNPSGSDDPPDHVLEELMEAFSEESAPQYNFDDPSIDRILGITDEHDAPEPADQEQAQDVLHDDDPDDDVDDEDQLDVDDV